MRIEHNLSYYRRIQGVEGTSNRREAILQKVKRAIDKDWKRNLDCEHVIVLDRDGNEREQDLKILKGTTRMKKKVRTRPDDVLRLGEIIKWRDTVWMVRTLDPDNKIQYSADIHQCALVLRWKLADGTMHDEFGEVDDASKYGSGTDETDYMQTPYFSVKVRVPVNQYTLDVQRDTRFLLGKIGQGKLRPFILTRVNDVTYRYVYEAGDQIGTGYIEWTMTEDYERESKDDQTEGVADNVTSEDMNTNETDGWW